MCRRSLDRRWLTKEEKKRGLRISHSSDRLNDATDAKQEQKRRRAETDVFSDNNTFLFLNVIAVTSGKRVGLDERGRRSGDGLESGQREREAAVAAQSNLPSLLRQRAVHILRLLAPLADNANFALRREGNRARRKSHCPQKKKTGTGFLRHHLEKAGDSKKRIVSLWICDAGLMQ